MKSLYSLDQYFLDQLDFNTMKMTSESVIPFDEIKAKYQTLQTQTNYLENKQEKEKIDSAFRALEIGNKIAANDFTDVAFSTIKTNEDRTMFVVKLIFSQASNYDNQEIIKKFIDNQSEEDRKLFFNTLENIKKTGEKVFSSINTPTNENTLAKNFADKFGGKISYFDDNKDFQIDGGKLMVIENEIRMQFKSLHDRGDALISMERKTARYRAFANTIQEIRNYVSQVTPTLSQPKEVLPPIPPKPVSTVEKPAPPIPPRQPSPPPKVEATKVEISKEDKQYIDQLISIAKEIIKQGKLKKSDSPKPQKEGIKKAAMHVFRSPEQKAKKQEKDDAIEKLNEFLTAGNFETLAQKSPDKMAQHLMGLVEEVNKKAKGFQGFSLYKGGAVTWSETALEKLNNLETWRKIQKPQGPK